MPIAPSTATLDATKKAEILRGLRSFLDALARGEEPLGAPPRLLRRAHTTAIPGVDGAEAEGPQTPQWPALPLAAGRTLTGEQVGRAVLAVLTSEVTGGAAPGAGATLARVKTALGEAGLDPSNVGRVAPALMLWLARAGVLADPQNPEAPWAEARQFVTLAADQVFPLLIATPPPAPAAVAEERVRGLK